jgi:hypothetical protein
MYVLRIQAAVSARTASRFSSALTPSTNAFASAGVGSAPARGALGSGEPGPAGAAAASAAARAATEMRVKREVMAARL